MNPFKIFNKERVYAGKSAEEGRKYGGLIAYFNLEEWWDSLSIEDRTLIRNWYSGGLGTGSQGDRGSMVDDISSIASSSQSASGFLNSLSGWAINEHKYEIAVSILKESLKNQSNYIDLHFTYNYLIDLGYKRREESPEWLENCIQYCKSDIDMFMQFKNAYISERKNDFIKSAKFDEEIGDLAEAKEWLKKAKDFKFDLGMPSFQRLTIIYEKKGEYEKAIEICKLALDYELLDSTKGGFEGRVSKLKRS